MTQFHSEDYVEFLKLINPQNMHKANHALGRYNFGEDCPVFEGLWDFCGISAGGSMEGAAHLNRKKCEVAVNWAGGLHHAKKNYASGFCYVNGKFAHAPSTSFLAFRLSLCVRLGKRSVMTAILTTPDCVLGILELLRYHKRVLYIDIDVHHGDGVEEAFYTTNRVMTVSFHKFGKFFPCTGHIDDIGADAEYGKSTGKYYSVNVPLRNGIDDFWYVKTFKQIIEAVMHFYKPEAVVLQCGADSLSGDRIGPFNLSIEGHAACVKEVHRYNLPTLVLGGGGYTVKNVALAWTKETGTVLGVGNEMDKAVPSGRYYAYYSPYFELEVLPSNMANENSEKYLQKVVRTVVERLKNLAAVPSVQSQVIVNGPTADDAMEDARNDEDQDLNPDLRDTLYRRDKRVDHPDEIMDGDDDEDLLEQGYNIMRNVSRDRERNHMDQGIEQTSSTLQAHSLHPEPSDHESAAEALVQLALGVRSTTQASSVAAPFEDSRMRMTYSREQNRYSNLFPSYENVIDNSLGPKLPYVSPYGHFVANGPGAQSGKDMSRTISSYLQQNIVDDAVVESELHSPQYNAHNQGPALPHRTPHLPRGKQGKNPAIVDHPPQRTGTPAPNIKRNVTPSPLAPMVAKIKTSTYDSRGREVYDSIEVEHPFLSHRALRKDTPPSPSTHTEPARDRQSSTPSAQRRAVKATPSPLAPLVALPQDSPAGLQPSVIQDAEEAQHVLTPSVVSIPAPVVESPEDQSDEEEEEESQGSSYVPSGRGSASPPPPPSTARPMVRKPRAD